MFKTKLLFCLFFIGTIGYAQTKLSPAILVTAHNDSLKVWVSLSEFADNLHSIKIKRDSLDKTSENWPASGIRSLAVVNGPYFTGAAVLIDKTPADIDVNSGLDSTYLSFAMDTVLLKAEFLGGKISLFSLIDRNKSHFFVRKPGGPITELFDRRYRLHRDDGVIDAEDKDYLHQLEELMQDCPDLAGNLLGVSYTVDALKKAARNYNACGQKGKTLYESEVRKGRLQIALLAGGGFSGIKATNSVYGTQSNTTLQSESTFAGGVSFDYFLSRTDKKFSIVGGVLYSQVKGSNSAYTEYQSASDYTLQSLTIDYTSLNVNVLCRYTIPLQGSLRPFLNAGFAFLGGLSHQNTSTTDEYYDNAHHLSSDDPFYGGFKSFQTGPEVGGGLRFKRLGLEYKFEWISNISSDPLAPVRVNAQQVVLFYNFRN